MKVRTSSLDGETIVLEVDEDDVGPIVDMLENKENGYAIFGEAVEVPLAVVDGRLIKEDWFSSDHLLAIEAHELGHIRMKSHEEPVAEREGIRLLESNGYWKAANILHERGIV